MSEELGSRVLDHLELVKRRRANAAKKSAAIVHASRDEGTNRNFSSRLREAWSDFGNIVHGGLHPRSEPPVLRNSFQLLSHVNVSVVGIAVVCPSALPIAGSPCCLNKQGRAEPPTFRTLRRA
ncbi:hypothetical protein AOLI_G00087740 [Acnodon oligacanthus]